MKLITVFTPTYNRAYCLHQVYDSLIVQTNKNFKWLIIDDGSIDNTKELVKSWLEAGKIEINYIYQENRGMHAGYNTAFDNITTELSVCIDSDDFMPHNAIEKIISFWKSNGNKCYAGIIGLDADKEGKIIGKKIPDEIISSTLQDIYYKHKINGDKKLVFRTEIVKKYPKYPIFKNESFVPLSSLYFQIDKDYKWLCTNDVYCIVEYLEDGSTKNIFKQYVRHPRGFRHSRIIERNYSIFFKIRFKALIHYVSSCIMLKEYNFFRDGNPIFLTLLAIPFGILLNIYIKIKNR